MLSKILDTLVTRYLYGCCPLTTADDVGAGSACAQVTLASWYQETEDAEGRSDYVKQPPGALPRGLISAARWDWRGLRSDVRCRRSKDFLAFLQAG